MEGKLSCIQIYPFCWVSIIIQTRSYTDSRGNYDIVSSCKTKAKLYHHYLKQNRTILCSIDKSWKFLTTMNQFRYSRKYLLVRETPLILDADVVYRLNKRRQRKNKEKICIRKRNWHAAMLDTRVVNGGVWGEPRLHELKHTGNEQSWFSRQ